ncbi:PssE/Cps14G family polysaccharide biosynthesis glycosyltransferase [Butyrivibrio sp. XBB1001]|uniref:PssE/Cps14G family polysaccharide biosynthesis glycosyltransferase n=1 Tax=Butyrivibrio sp. XBB1001 TaxID=1280682 RepID=UPI0003F84174|nr:PssE/Cps14G family polysaccharide biosynthesis glycosyltransferase [Butyrivibrio sp. XBB1001]
MIFITLGSQKFQFNRLLKEVDRLIENGVISDSVFAQIGNSDYEPKNYSYKRFLNREEFAQKQLECDVVITHGGTGAIIGALKKGKKVIAVPRLAKFGEHVDDHQLQLLHQFDEMHLIEPCYDIADLANAYKRLFVTEYRHYISNTRAVIEVIDKYISSDVIVKENRNRKTVSNLTHLVFKRL